MKQEKSFSDTVDINDFITDYIKNNRTTSIFDKSTPSEYINEFFMFAHAEIQIDDVMLADAIETLKISEEYAKENEDLLKVEIKCSYDDAFSELLQSKFAEQLKEHIEEQKYFDCFLDKDGKKTENFWEAVEAKFTITRSEVVHDFVGTDCVIMYEDIDYCVDNLEYMDGIDYNFKADLDGVWVGDEWKDILKERSEVASEYKTN